jgi:hypothetical protein
VNLPNILRLNLLQMRLKQRHQRKGDADIKINITLMNLRTKKLTIKSHRAKYLRSRLKKYRKLMHKNQQLDKRMSNPSNKFKLSIKPKFSRQHHQRKEDADIKRSTMLRNHLTNRLRNSHLLNNLLVNSHQAKNLITSLRSSPYCSKTS